MGSGQNLPWSTSIEPCFSSSRKLALITSTGLRSQDPGSSPDSAANYLCDSGQVTLPP